MNRRPAIFSRFANRTTARLLLALALFAPVVAQAEDLLIFAAASLKPSLDTIIATPEVTALGSVKASYAASSQLAKQIEAGAPAALFISADQDWMNYVDEKKLVVAGTRMDILGNALVLIAPKDSTLKLDIKPGFDLVGALGKDGKLALGEPNSVPAGKYAKAALTQLGIWDAVSAHVASAENVRAALNFVARGEAPLGVVYRSDAISEPAVRVVGTFPDGTHARIVYPAALIAGHDSPAARKLLDLLHAAPEQTIFRTYGFDAPAK
ncbi:MAG: molybdate ABC transporter substrate-binding protein [Dokdonella sp.]|uniref:molybdate ABC transporter substrate-binding protein n=1 Tax=Dokdonella sp. TaxID=2291710 RepID=UPI0032631DC5